MKQPPRGVQTKMKPVIPMDMKSMKISNSNLLPLAFLPILLASCNDAPQSIDFGHDSCSLCERTIINQEFAAQAMSTDGNQFNYDSIECLVQHIGQEDTEMAVIKVADFQHPGFMLNAHQSHFMIQGSTKNTQDAKLVALRHNRSNTLCWKEMQAQLLHQAGYISQSRDSVNRETRNYQ